MARAKRVGISDVCFHVVSRGNARNKVFFEQRDYEHFVRLMTEAKAKIPIRLFGFCLMPNHFHLMVSAYEEQGMSRWMQWLLTTHVRRTHDRTGGSGHIWQGRFKSFPVELGEHFYTVLRYIERNPVSSGLVTHSQDWPWSSAQISHLLTPWPIGRPPDWRCWVDMPRTEKEMEQLRQSVARGVPFGSEPWVERIVAQLGLQSTLRPRGRPARPLKEA